MLNMLRGMLGSMKSENPKGKGKLGNGKIRKKIINVIWYFLIYRTKIFERDKLSTGSPVFIRS